MATNGDPQTAETIRSASPPVTITIDTKQMQSELERRQQELEDKARELAQREEALWRAGGEFKRQHNWPPIPSFCPIKPCFFQDISVDISPEFQKTVRLGYQLWCASALVLFVNILGAISLMVAKVDNGTELGFGILVFVFVVPLTYVAWFRPLYKAFKNDSSFNFMVFFFVFFMKTFMFSLWALGLPLGGPCGIYTALSTLGQGKLLSLFMFIVTGFWVAYAVASILYLIRIHSIYRSSGATMAKARNELAQGIITRGFQQG